MAIMNSTKAQENFGTLITKAQREPVQIERHGKPVAMVLSMEDYENLQAAAKAAGAPENRQKLFADAAAGVFTESDEVLRRLAHR